MERKRSRTLGAMQIIRKLRETDSVHRFEPNCKNQKMKRNDSERRRRNTCTYKYLWRNYSNIDECKSEEKVSIAHSSNAFSAFFRVFSRYHCQWLRPLPPSPLMRLSFECTTSSRCSLIFYNVYCVACS